MKKPATNGTKSAKAPVTTEGGSDTEVAPEDTLRETIRSAKAPKPTESGETEVELDSTTEIEGEEPSNEELSEIEGSDLDTESISRQIDAFLDSRFSTPPATMTPPK